jgi:TonB family protein
VAEGSLPDSALQRVHAAVLARAEAWPRDTLAMLVRLDADGPIEDMKGGERQPELRNRPEIADAMTRFVESHLNIGPIGATFTAMMRMAVSRTGQVVYSEIVEPSGNLDVDAFAVGLGRRMRFAPARVGSQAVDVWVALPITVRLLPPNNL